MITKAGIEAATAAYLQSYNYALKETKNPGLAVQAAMSVTTVIITVEGNKQPQTDPMQEFLAQLVQKAQRNQNDKEGD